VRWFLETVKGRFEIRQSGGRFQVWFDDDNLGSYATPDGALEDLVSGACTWTSLPVANLRTSFRRRPNRARTQKRLVRPRRRRQILGPTKPRYDAKPFVRIKMKLFHPKLESQLTRSRESLS
jgi:hypothetical protein